MIPAFIGHALRWAPHKGHADILALLLAVEFYAAGELLDDLLFRAGARGQTPEAIAAARALGAPARARRMEDIHRQDLEAEQLLALDLMEM